MPALEILLLRIANKEFVFHWFDHESNMAFLLLSLISGTHSYSGTCIWFENRMLPILTCAYKLAPPLFLATSCFVLVTEPGPQSKRSCCEKEIYFGEEPSVVLKSSCENQPPPVKPRLHAARTCALLTARVCRIHSAPATANKRTHARLVGHSCLGRTVFMRLWFVMRLIFRLTSPENQSRHETLTFPFDFRLTFA
jgi:hypothetical protein